MVSFNQLVYCSVKFGFKFKLGVKIPKSKFDFRKEQSYLFKKKKTVGKNFKKSIASHKYCIKQ